MKAEYKRLHGKAHEEKLTLPASTSKSAATKRYGEWLSIVEGNIAAIRAARDGTGISLTPREAAALSGQWYLWFTTRPDIGGRRDWERWRDAVQQGVLAALSDEERKAAHDLDDLWENHRGVREAVRPILADIGQTAQFLATQTPLNNAARDMFLDCLYSDLAAAIKLFERRAGGDYSTDAYVERFPKARGNDSRITVSDLFDRWLRAGEPAAGTIENWRYFFRDLAAHMDGRSAGSLTKKEAEDWIKGLVTPKRKIGTVANTWLRACKAVFNYGLQENLVAENPFAHIKLKVPKSITSRPKSFHPNEVAAILSAALKVTDTTSPDDAAKRWVPWLCAYTGARAGEITQLRRQDVVKHGETNVLVFTPDAGTIKSRQARMVPIHEHLCAQGFLEFVKSRKHGPLFYAPRNEAAPADKTKVKKAAASQARQRVGEWVRETSVADEGVRPNHGWRHTFILIGRDNGIDATVLKAICGHAAKSVSDAYGTATLTSMARAMAKFPRYKLEEQSTS